MILFVVLAQAVAIGPVARQPGLHHELVLIGQSQLRQRQRERHASHEQSATRPPLQLLNGLPQISTHELRVPIDLVKGARYDSGLTPVRADGRHAASIIS